MKLRRFKGVRWHTTREEEMVLAIGMFFFWLILAFLAFTNKDSVASIFSNVRDLAVADTLALQGR